MTISDPVVSIILPNLNGGKYLEGAILSFTRQDYPNKQLVIVDSKSTDSSHEIIARCQDTSPDMIVWVREPDQGLSDAINIGIKHSSGEVIGYLGSDDLLYRGILVSVAYHLELFDYDAIYFDSYTYFVEARASYARKCPRHQVTTENLLKYGNIVPLQDIFFRRRVFDKHQFNAQNNTCMDYELLLEMSREDNLFVYVEQVATINRFDQNISHRQADRQMKEAISVARRFATGSQDMFFDPGYKKVWSRFRRLIQVLTSSRSSIDYA